MIYFIMSGMKFASSSCKFS